MSQYPSPYSTPTPQQPAPYPFSYGDPSRPTRRAGILMITLGSIGLLCGICTSMSLLVNRDAMLAQQPAQLRSLMEHSGSATASAWVSGIILGTSLLNLIFGILTLRGSRAGAIGGIVLGGIGTLYFVLNALAGAAVTITGNVMGLLVVGLSAVALVVFLLQLMWAIGALKGSSQIAQSSAAYQAQYWQYVQQQQMYQQAYNQNPYNAPPAGGQPAANQGWQWPAAPGPAAPPAATSQAPTPFLPAPPPPPTDGGPHGQDPQ